MQLISGLSAGQDFLSQPMQLLLSAGPPGQRACGSITILQDSALEGPQSFTAVLTSSDGGVGITPNIATATITDDDGQL